MKVVAMVVTHGIVTCPGIKVTMVVQPIGAAEIEKMMNIMKLMSEQINPQSP